MSDPFVLRHVVGGGAGALSGLDFAAKDLFDVAGTRSLWGTPDRAAEAPIATAHAMALLPLFAAGARLVGKTVTDELACGMFGENPHDGTPDNPAAPDRVPGGSSSGSASAVASGAVDFAMGTDTGGSVRVPASFCGLWGIRTTHGRIATAGVMPMAPSFDTVGWLAREPAMLARVGEVFFGPVVPRLPRILLAADAFALCSPAVRDAALAAAARFAATPIRLYEEGVEHWLATFRPTQLNELWSTHGEWATRPGRRLSPAVAERIALARATSPSPAAWPAREALTARLHALLADGSMLLIPTVHDLPPKRPAGVESQIEFRDRTLALTCIASLCRLPQISMPLASVDGVPVGLSLIAGPMQDAALLGAALTQEVTCSN